MNLNSLTNSEKHILSLINKDRVENKKVAIKWDRMPKQEVLTHLYGWDNKHISIKRLLTPKEKELLKSKGYKIKNSLKENIPLLKSIRNTRKNPR
jgi:hypothetical protein